MDGDADAGKNPGGSTAAVQSVITGIIAEMLNDWGTPTDDLVAETLLSGDLEFASVDIIHLVVAIEEHFGQGRMNFQDLLLKDGRYVDDLSIGDLAGFVAEKLR